MNSVAVALEVARACVVKFGPCWDGSKKRNVAGGGIRSLRRREQSNRFGRDSWKNGAKAIL